MIRVTRQRAALYSLIAADGYDETSYVWDRALARQLNQSVAWVRRVAKGLTDAELLFDRGFEGLGDCDEDGDRHYAPAPTDEDPYLDGIRQHLLAKAAAA